MRILITDPHLQGGGQVRYVSNLAGQLTRRGHEVAIGCKPGSVLIDRAREAACSVQDGFSFRGGLRPRAWRNDVQRMTHLIQTAPPDIIHVNGSQDHWVAAFADRLLGRPVCLVRTRHNTYPVHDAWPNRVLNRLWTDYQIVVCHVVRERLARQRAFDPARLCTVHNGVDAEQYRPEPDMRQRARAEFGYTPDHIVCGVAARLVTAKGHEFLFHAVAGLRREFPALRVLVLGQGDLAQRLKNLAGDLGIDDLVHFAGFRDDMAYCTQAMDIGVQPSIDCDTSSFSLKEQMAAEKPVVCSDYGGLTEIIDHAVEGLIVPAGTVEPLANALRTLIRRPEQRLEMGRRGRHRVLRDFTIDAFARRTEEAYERALDVHRPRKQ